MSGSISKYSRAVWEKQHLLWEYQQKIFPSRRNGSVRAVRDTPVEDYSLPGLNTTRRIAYRPLIAVLPFLLALLGTYFQQMLWHCGQQ